MKRSYPTPAGILELAILGFVVFSSLFSTVVMSLLNRFTFDQFFNLGEGLLWLGIALVITIRTARSRNGQRLGYGAALSFALFGVSDLIEVRTGAWYSPWPLLALKAACVASLGIHLFCYLREKRAAHRDSVTLDQQD
jgi:hypothetical protein